MKLIFRIANAIARRLQRWADKGLTGKVDPDVFKYVDCLHTVRAFNRYHKTVRLCDIGANSGNWSFVMYQLNPALEEVVMFEPQAKLIGNLHSLALPGVKKSVFQCAVGEREERLMLGGGTPSASLLPVGDNQHDFFPGSTNEESEQVEVKVLDDIYISEGLEYPDLIKIDVQGFELNVLRGAKNILANARYLVIELSLQEFYKGQPPLWELWRLLDESQYVMLDHGYELRSPKPPFELLQFDAIFMNTRFAKT